MRRSPRALAAWAAALLVALATARLVAADLATLHRSARAFGAPRATLVAARDLPLGATLRSADVRVVRLAADHLPEGLLGSADQAVGRVVRVPVVAGTPVTLDHLADPDRDGSTGPVPPGFRAVRVPADDGLVPPPGSVVDVLVTFDPSLVADSGGGDPTVAVARAALVLASEPAGSSEGGTAAGSPAPGITLLVTEEEAHRLAFALAHGVVTLALAPPEDACCKTSSSESSRD